MAEEYTDTTMVFKIEGTLYPLDLKKLDFGDYVTIKRMTEGECYNMDTLGLALLRDDYPATVALVYVAMRKTNKQVAEEYAYRLTIDQIDIVKDPSVPPLEASNGRGEVIGLSREMDEISGDHSTPESTESDLGSLST